MVTKCQLHSFDLMDLYCSLQEKSGSAEASVSHTNVEAGASLTVIATTKITHTFLSSKNLNSRLESVTACMTCIQDLIIQATHYLEDSLEKSPKRAALYLATAYRKCHKLDDQEKATTLEKIQGLLDKALNDCKIGLDSKEVNAKKISQYFGNNKYVMKYLGLDLPSIESASYSKFTNLPQTPPDFTGRIDELQELHELCKHLQRVVIAGLGGVGKTSLALQYGQEHRDSYQFIHFIAADNPQSMIDGLLKLADALRIPAGNPQERLDWLKTRLESFDKEYLLIFDGVDDPQSFKEIQKHFPQRGKCLLVTSRLKEEWRRLNFKLLEIDVLMLEDAVDYLTKATGIQDRENASILAEKLGRLPLALTHAASYIRVQQCSIEEYIRLFEKYQVKLYEQEFLILKEGEKTVLTTWQITMDTIETEEKCSYAKPLMQFISCLAHAAIPFKVIEEWFIAEYDKEELQLRRILGLLQNYSMLSKGEVQKSYQLHALIQMVQRYYLTEDEYQNYLDTTLKVFHKLTNGVDAEDFQTRAFLSPFMPHFEKVTNALKETTHETAYLLSALLQVMWSFNYHSGRYKNSLSSVQKDLELCSYARRSKELEKVANDTCSKYEEKSNICLERADARNRLGMSLGALGRHEEALKYKMEALELFKTFHEERHPSVAASLNNVGMSLGALGRHEGALRYQLEALELRKTLLGENHPSVATSLNNVGGILGELGRHEEALKYQLEALKLRKALLGENHLSVATSLNNVGGILGELGRHEEALKYQLEALKLTKNLLEQNHPSVATSLNNLGSTLGELGKHEEALKYQMEALKLRKALFGENHPSVATSLNNVGTNLEALGRHKEALKYKIEALELYKALLGERHHSVATSLNNVGISLRALGRPEEALNYLVEALELRKALLGERHPLVATSLSNVGGFLAELGKHEEALKYKMEALELRKALLGDTYPNTSTSLDDVGTLERQEEALKHKQEALELKKALLGRNHSSVATSLNEVGGILRELGRYEEALKYQLEALELFKVLLGERHSLVATKIMWERLWES